MVQLEAAQLLIAEMWRAGLQFDDPVRSEPLGPDPDDDYLLALAEAATAVLATGDLALIEHAGAVTVLSPRRVAGDAGTRGHIGGFAGGPSSLRSERDE